MRIPLILCLLIAGIANAQVAPIPMVNEINGQPFVIRDKWTIGGTGNWGYLALDPVARQLFIAHQATVQVVDLETGRLTGEIAGFEEARSIALDPDGQFGYVSDGKANLVVMFDRRRLEEEARIPLACSPRSLVLVPGQPLLLAICGSATPPPADAPPVHVPHTPSGSSRRPRSSGLHASKGDSKIVLIDTQDHRILGYVSAPGDFRAAVADSSGQVYITVGPAERSPNLAEPLAPLSTFPPVVVRFDAAHAAARARGVRSARATGASAAFSNWTALPPDESADITFRLLDSSCPSPQGLAEDSHNGRLFVACDNQNLFVLNSDSGRLLTTLTTGPGTDAIAYDEGRGLIFTANGGGYGSVTVVRQHVSDSYAVIQNVPTMERARTMALDSSTGQVYLVTDLHGVKLGNPPADGIGKLEMKPVDGSFQVLVIGN